MPKTCFVTFPQVLAFAGKVLFPELVFNVAAGRELFPKVAPNAGNVEFECAKAAVAFFAQRTW